MTAMLGLKELKAGQVSEHRVVCIIDLQAYDTIQAFTFSESPTGLLRERH